MPITKQQRVIWDPASPGTVPAGNALESPAIPIGQDAIGVDVEIQVSGAGTGTVDIYLLRTTGDLDTGVAGNDYDTPNHGTFLCRLDLSADNPARRTVTLDSTAMQGWKLRAVNNDGANSVSIVAIASEQNAA